MITQTKKNLEPSTNLGAFKGGSLPNVSEPNRKQQTNTQMVNTASTTGKKVYKTVRTYSMHLLCVLSSFIICQ